MANQDSWTLDSIVEAYKPTQRRMRGLREPTLKSYEQILRPFLRFCLGDDPLDPALLTPTDVVQFVKSMQDRYSARSMKNVCTALRSLLRFLRMNGCCDEKLELAIPAIAHWRLATLPRCLNEQQLKQVQETFDPRTPCGLRDRALVLCLSTLGLKPRELAQLCLEDINWRGGTLRLRTRKTRRGAVLPLPRKAGRAIVSYLRKERPTTSERRLFVQHGAGRRGMALSAAAITAAAVRAVQRAGIKVPRGCAYVFRHTLASRLVARGATLKEVADFLGHQCLDTTTIYAKLDLSALREVALPWPQVLP